MKKINNSNENNNPKQQSINKEFPLNKAIKEAKMRSIVEKAQEKVIENHKKNKGI